MQPRTLYWHDVICILLQLNKTQGRVEGELTEHVNALFTINEQNTVDQELVEKRLATRRAVDVRQDRDITALFFDARDFKDKLFQVSVTAHEYFHCSAARNVISGKTYTALQCSATSSHTNVYTALHFSETSILTMLFTAVKHQYLHCSLLQWKVISHKIYTPRHCSETSVLTLLFTAMKSHLAQNLHPSSLQWNDIFYQHLRCSSLQQTSCHTNYSMRRNIILHKTYTALDCSETKNTYTALHCSKTSKCTLLLAVVKHHLPRILRLFFNAVKQQYLQRSEKLSQKNTCTAFHCCKTLSYT